MERTELRDQFFEEVKRDPYTHMITRMLGDAWAEGYNQALRDAAENFAGRGQRDVAGDLQLIRHRKSHSERVDDAIEFMTDARRKAEAQMIIAMANLGARLPWPPKL